MSKNYELLSQNGKFPSQPGKVAKPAPLLMLSARSAKGPKRAKENDELDFDLHSALQALLRRRVLIYICTATMLLASGLVCIVMPSKYKAESTLEVLRQDVDGLSLGDSNSSARSSDALDFNLTLQTQLAVLKSDTLAWQVIRELKLGDTKEPASPLPMESAAKPQVAALGDRDKRAAAILEKFKSNLNIESIAGTRLIKVSYADRDPRRAARVVNQLVSDFVEYNFQVRYSATTKATDWLGSQLVELKSQVEKAQARAAQLQKDSGILGEDERHNIVLTRLEQLNSQVTSTQADRVTKEAIYKLCRSGNPEFVAGILGSQPEQTASGAANSAALLNNLRQQEATLDAEYADAAAKYGPAYPRLIQIKERLGSVRSSIATELRKVTERAKSEYELAASREAAAMRAFGEQKALAAQMNNKAIDFLIAKREADSSQKLYEHLLEKLKEAGVLAGLRSSELHIVDPAEVPNRPFRPNIPLYLALGVMAGMSLGVVCAFVTEMMDRSVRKVSEIEDTTYVPVLGVVPQAGLFGSTGFTHRLKAHADHNGGGENQLLVGVRNPAVAEAFRSVRTTLLLSRPDEPAKVFLITSGTAQEGKSFASLNLAAALARNAGKVLLVDADLRRGTLSRALNQQSEIGLSDVLSGESHDEAAYHSINEVPGLTFVPAGVSPRCRSELLGSEQMTATLQRWREDFAYVVVDTPPVLAVSDAVVLSPRVDSVIVVVRFGVTKRQSIIRTVQMLKSVQAANIGVLMNAIDTRSPEYYDYSGTYGYADYHNAGAGEGQLLVPGKRG
jgi:succinoglycan biosynthesis transport protein ExoP